MVECLFECLNCVRSTLCRRVVLKLVTSIQAERFASIFVLCPKYGGLVREGLSRNDMGEKLALMS
jgi:hypothetical protein